MEASRHLKAIFSRVAADFISATGEGLGVGVAVTYRELIIAKARLFRGPLLRRYRLRDVRSIRLRRGASMSFLLVSWGEPEPTTVMILYQTAAAGDFERVAAAILRLSHRRRCMGQARRSVAGRQRSVVRRYDERQPSMSVMA